MVAREEINPVNQSESQRATGVTGVGEGRGYERWVEVKQERQRTE